MRFDLDEPLFPPHHVLPGLLGALEIDGLEHEWKAAKVDEWCAVRAITSAGDAVRRAIGAPSTAPITAVLAVAESGDYPSNPRVARALDAYHHAATVYEGARTNLGDIRRRALAAPTI